MTYVPNTLKSQTCQTHWGYTVWLEVKSSTPPVRVLWPKRCKTCKHTRESFSTSEWTTLCMHHVSHFTSWVSVTKHAQTANPCKKHRGYTVWLEVKCFDLNVQTRKHPLVEQNVLSFKWARITNNKVQNITRGNSVDLVLPLDRGIRTVVFLVPFIYLCPLLFPKYPWPPPAPYPASQYCTFIGYTGQRQVP